MASTTGGGSGSRTSAFAASRALANRAIPNSTVRSYPSLSTTGEEEAEAVVDGVRPKRFDSTWAVAGSRSVGNVMTTPRTRSAPPRGQNYGAWNHAHHGLWAQVVMPHGRLARPGSRTPRGSQQSHDDLQQVSGAHLLERELAMRDAGLRQRELKHRQDLIERARGSPANRMPRGRTQMGSDFNSPSASARGGGSSRRPAILSWAERMSGSRAAVNAQSDPNPFAYKAAFDQGRIHVLTNWRQGFAGKGAERYMTGDLYVGDIKCGERQGNGVYQLNNGQVLLSQWSSNEPVGEGVQWTADRTQAVRVVDGRPDQPINEAQARQISKKLGAPNAAYFHHSRPFTWGVAIGEPSASQGDGLNAAKARRQAQGQQQQEVVRV